MDLIYTDDERNVSTVDVPNTAAAAIGQANETHMPIFWKLDYIILSIMVSILSFVGIVGNIPVLIVYFRRKDKKASNTFIKVLAFVDLIVCLFIMPYTIVYEFHLVETDVMCRTMELIRHFTISASNFTLVAIAAERYIAVCQIGTKVSVGGINKGVLGIIIASAFFAAPSVGTFAVVSEQDVQDVPCSFPHEVTEGRFCHFTYTVMGKLFVTAYQGLLMITFFVILVAIIVLYTIVYVVLWNKTKIRRQLNKQRESLTTEYDCLRTFQQESTKQLAPIDEEENSPCNEVNPYSTAIKVPDIPVVFNMDDVAMSLSQPFQNGHMTQTKTDMVVSQQKKCVVSKSVSRKKKVSMSRGSVDIPIKKRYYHRRTAKMLFLCTVVYFLTWLPFWLDIWGLTNSKVIRYLFFIGHAANPIIYGIVNEKVRQSFKQLLFSCFSKWCVKKREFSTACEISVNSTSGTEIKRPSR